MTAPVNQLSERQAKRLERLAFEDPLARIVDWSIYYDSPVILKTDGIKYYLTSGGHLKPYI